MKKIIFFALLINIQNVLSLESSTVNTSLQTPKDPHAKKDLIKVLVALGSAGIFGYLSYQSSLANFEKDIGTMLKMPPIDDGINRESFIFKINSYIRKKIKTIIFSKPLTMQTLRYKNIKGYFMNHSLPILNIIIAFQCAHYGISKLSNLLNKNKSLDFSPKVPLMRSKIAYFFRFKAKNKSIHTK